MDAFISLIADNEAKDFPIPLTSTGQPMFIPQRGDQIFIEGKEYVVEGVKWYHKQDLDWTVAVYVHQIVH
jgi:hypothetical protein